jgi:hypothetical protein
MAEPSLGYAIGLNVKRQDIFAPAAKVLSQNLATWKAEKAQAKKEKEAKASKVMADIMKFDPSNLNRKVRPEAQIEFEKSTKELENAIEAGESEQKMMQIIYQANKNLARYRDQSENRNALEQQVRTNPDSVPTVLRNFSANNLNDLTPDEIELLAGFGSTYDPNTKIITSFGFRPTDVRATLNSAKPTEEEMIVSATPEQLKKNAEVIKIKSGYSPMAFVSLNPDQQRYALALANVMDKDPGAIASISEEVLRRDYGGDYNRYLEATRLKLNELKSDTKEGEQLPTPLDAQRALGIDYMIKTHAPEWIQSSTRIKELNEPSKSGSSKKDAPTPNPASTTEESHLSTAGKKLAKDLGMDEETAINISLNRVAATPEEKAKANKITKNNILGAGPTISFNTGGTEPVTIGFGNINPRKLWYDKKNKKFHLFYDKQVSGEGTSYNLSGEDRALTWEQLKQLSTSKNASVKSELEQWDLNAAVNGVPTISGYILSRGSARAAASGTSSTGTSTYNWSGGK